MWRYINGDRSFDTYVTVIQKVYYGLKEPAFYFAKNNLNQSVEQLLGYF